jgi:DNA end-binding protein Ku
MAARTIWKGHISFGLVQIPVGLYPATQDQDLAFHLIDKRDQSPIGYKKVNKRTGLEVTQADIVKAVEWDEGEYVVLDEDDFAKANVEATQTVAIVAFVDAGTIEPRYFVRPYYVAPTKKSSKAYALLREVMKRTGKVGVAKVVLRTRQYVAALMPSEDMLVLELLRYDHELRSIEEHDVPSHDLAKLGVTPRELKMAEALVEGLSDTWQPDQYRDDFHDDLVAIIEEKAKTGQVTTRHAVAEEGGGAEVVDIMSLLKRSIEASGKQAKPATAQKKPAHTGKALVETKATVVGKRYVPKKSRDKATAAEDRDEPKEKSQVSGRRRSR